MKNINRRDFLGFLGAGAAWAVFPAGCSKDGFWTRSKDTRPNILWIVWDTVRADHLSLHGYGKLTTPYLDSWAQGARVFDNCISIANCTVPTHVSMFTGLMPSEHQCNNTENYVDDAFTPVTELLRESGYQTYLSSANAHISRSFNFTQGFDITEHPWDYKYKREAYRILKRKILPQDKSSKLPEKIRSQQISKWSIKACGRILRFRMRYASLLYL